MNISFHTSPTAVPPPGLDNTTGTQNTGKSTNKTLTIVAEIPVKNNDTVTATQIKLEFPLIGLEDVKLNEALQELEKLGASLADLVKGKTSVEAFAIFSGVAMGILKGIVEGGEQGLKDNFKKVDADLQAIENQASELETSLFELINNSKYPDFREFLGKMLIAAQELRALAADARQKLVMAEYQTVLDQAGQMFKAAEATYQAALKEIAAERAQAIGKIVGGVVSIGTTAFGGYAGGLMGMQAGGALGTAISGVTDGITSLVAGGLKTSAAEYRREADIAAAVQKQFEATQKLLQEGQNVAQELKDIAKTLADMVLKLYQDFMSSQNQIIQRANI
jgi:hypothetical protein